MNNKIEKNKSLKIICEAANLYNNNLNNKDILFLVKNEKRCLVYEFRFKTENFLHFTGMVTKKISPSDFFHRAITNKLSINDYEYKDDFTTSKKLLVLKDAMKLNTSAKMLGNFIGKGAKIKADISSGNTSVSMTFNISRKNTKGYPVSVLSEDIRNISSPTNPIIAILVKNINEKAYTRITYKSKNINIDKLHFPKEIKELLTEKALYELKPSLAPQPKIIDNLSFDEVLPPTNSLEQSQDKAINEIATIKEEPPQKDTITNRLAQFKEKAEKHNQQNKKQQNIDNLEH